MQRSALVQYDFFSNLSAMIPPPMEAVRPQPERARALSIAYSALKAGKFLPKKTGRKDDTIIPPKFLNEEAMRTFLAVGKVKTTPMFLTKAASGLPWAAYSASFLAFFSASFFFVAPSRKLPLTGSLTVSIVARPKRVPKPAIIPYYALHPKDVIRRIENDETATPI